MVRLSIIGSVVLVAAVGCSSPNVTADYKPSTDFSAYRTYDWKPRPATAPGDTLGDSTLVAARIRNAVDAELGARGYTTASASPDFRITYQAALGAFEWNINDRILAEGTLILDFVDPNTNQLIWRGVALDVLDFDLTPDERQERVNAAVAKMIERLPK